jgi:hypothetical protein
MEFLLINLPYRAVYDFICDDTELLMVVNGFVKVLLS